MCRLTALSLSLFTLCVAGCDALEDTKGSGDTGTLSSGTTLTGDDDDDATTGDDDDDDAGGHASACAGPQVGSYQLDGYPVTGDVTGELLADGTLFVTFVTSAGDTDAVGEVSAVGVMSGAHEGVSISGTYDLVACQGAGRWVNSRNGTEGDYDLGAL